MLPLGGGRGGWQPAEEDIEDLGLEELGEWFWYKKKTKWSPMWTDSWVPVARHVDKNIVLPAPVTV
jgi:hypothetical protein